MEDDYDEDLEDQPEHDLDLIFYLKNRIEPLHVRAAFRVPQSVLDIEDEDERVRTFMDIIEGHILGVIDTYGEHRYVFTNTSFSRQIVLVPEIQSISVLAPDKTTLTLMAN